MKRQLRLLMPATLAFILNSQLIACSTVITPEMHYYRLTDSGLASNTAGKTIQKLAADFELSDFKVTGLLSNNQLLYIDLDKPNELKSYYFHQWHAPLSELLSSHLLDYLNAHTDRPVVKYDFKSFNDFLIVPRLQALEIQYASNETALFGKLQIVVKNSVGKIIFRKTYHHKIKLDSKDIYQLVSTYDQLLTNIYNDVVNDLAAIKKPG